MATPREELYEQFGPRLMEAVALVILDEVNIVRTDAGLAERTPAQLVTSLENKLTTIPEKIYGRVEDLNNG